MQCSSRRLDGKRLLCLQLDPSHPAISLYLIDQLNDMILSSKITEDEHTRPLLGLFADLQSFYQYLSSEDSEVQVTQKDSKLVLKYEIVNLLKEVTQNEILIQAQTYLPSYHIVSHKQTPEDHSLRRDQSIASERELVFDGEHRIEEHSENPNGEVRSLQGHPGWFLNMRQKLLLQVGTLNYTSQEKHWDVITHRMDINLNRYHLSEEEAPRYDVTFGLAPRHLFPKLRQSFNEALAETISLTMMGRKITSQCLSLREQLQFRNVLSPQSLQLYVTCCRKTNSMRVLRIQFFLNQHKQINVFGQDRMQQFQQKLQHLQDFVVFLYLHRSFLHFSFNRSTLPLMDRQSSPTII